MKYKKQLSPFIYYTSGLLLFFIDTAIFSLSEKALVYSMLCFYVLQLKKQISWWRILFLLFLLCLNSLLHYGRFSLELLYLLPITAMGLKIKHIFYNRYWHYYALLMAALLAKILLIEYLLIGLPISLSYTFSILFANMIIVWCMSLKL